MFYILQDNDEINGYPIEGSFPSPSVATREM